MSKCWYLSTRALFNALLLGICLKGEVKATKKETKKSLRAHQNNFALYKHLREHAPFLEMCGICAHIHEFSIT